MSDSQDVKVGESADRSKCISRLEFLVSKNPRVHRMLEAIEGLGCEIPKNFFSCRSCDGTVSGGFTPNTGEDSRYVPKTVMCDTPMDDTTFENTLVHELVHAYDQCKQKLDWKNCLHHACSEVRASNLSGECSYRQEFNRGHKDISNGGRACVQRRAALSVSANPHCKSVAKDAVLAVYDFCSHDAAPLEDAKYED